MLRTRTTLILLLIILAIAAFFRFFQLDSIPPGLWPDETAYANDALSGLKTGDFKVFYPENHGREGLFMWLLAFSFSVFGVSLWSFKIVPAAIGVLTVLGMYLLTKELFNASDGQQRASANKIALLSAFFLAISFWHINFSRIGFRAILAPLVLVFSFYFFFRALRTKKIRDFLVSGLIFGTGFYTYISFRLAVLLLAFALVFWFFVALKKKWGVKYLACACLLLLTVFIVGLPIGIYFLENPEHFASRALGVSVFEQEDPLKEFIKSFGTHLLMFNFAGDRNWRHNLSGFPQLSPLAGVFFLVGLCWAIYQVVLLSKTNSPDKDKLAKIGGLLFLFVWFFALLLPSALTVEGIPHALRAIGVIPAAYLFSGLGAYLVYQWGKNKYEQKQIKVSAFKTTSFFVLVMMVLSSFFMYFVVWTKSPQLADAFTVRFSDVGKELNALPVETKKYVIKNEGDLPSEVPKFIQGATGRDEAVYIQPREIEIIDFSPGDFVFLMNKEINFLDPLRERFPEGILYEKERILIFEVR